MRSNAISIATQRMILRMVCRFRFAKRVLDPNPITVRLQISDTAGEARLAVCSIHPETFHR
jgi:hypothetical protein